MYPPLMVEMLAAAHQGDLVDEAERERVGAALVGQTSPWWQPIVTSLRHLAVAGVRRQGSEDLDRQVAVANRA